MRFKPRPRPHPLNGRACVARRVSLVVQDLNGIAREIVSPAVEEVVDLHKTVTDHCGLNYTDCDWCRRHPCSYHYNDVGESEQAAVVASAFKRHL